MNEQSNKQILNHTTGNSFTYLRTETYNYFKNWDMTLWGGDVKIN